MNEKLWNIYALPLKFADRDEGSNHGHQDRARRGHLLVITLYTLIIKARTILGPRLLCMAI